MRFDIYAYNGILDKFIWLTRQSYKYFHHYKNLRRGKKLFQYFNSKIEEKL